jgi:MFS family permease
MDAILLSEHEHPTRDHYRILFMSWAGWVFDFYDLVLYAFLKMAIQGELHLSDVEIGTVLGVSIAATAVGGVIFGVLSDRFGRKVVLQWTIITYSVGTLLSGFSWSLTSLVVFRIVTGLGVGGEWATGQTYIGETFPPRVRGRYGALMQTGAPIGVALASFMGGIVAPAIGWRGAFFISFIPAFLVIFIRRALPESDLWLERRRRIAAGEIPSEAQAEERRSRLLALVSPQYRRLFLLCLVLALFGMSAYWFTYSWLPDYLHRERHFSMAKSAIWMIVMQGGGLAGYASFGFLADRLGRRPAFSIYGFLMALGLVMVTLLWGLVAAHPPVILSFIALVGFGTGIFGGYGPVFAELFPTSIRGTAMATAFNVARGVQFATPVLIALVAPRYGLSGGISLAALFALLTGAWVWTLPETRGRKLDVM